MLYFIPIIISSINATNSSNNPTITQSTLDTLSNTITQGLTTQSLNVGFPLLTFNVTTTVFNTDGTVYQNNGGSTNGGATNGGSTNGFNPSSETNNSKLLIIILATVVPTVVIVLVLVTFALIRKRSQVHSDPQLFTLEQNSENIIPNNS